MEEQFKKSKCRVSLSLAILSIFLFPCYSCTNHKTAENKESIRPVAVVHADQIGTPINRYAYGMFTELLGNMFEKGTWAEVLSDRKFFFPVNSDTASRRARPGFNRWRPVGSDDLISMECKYCCIQFNWSLL